MKFNYLIRKFSFRWVFALLVVLAIFIIGSWQTKGFNNLARSHLSHYYQNFFSASPVLISQDRAGYPSINPSFNSQPEITADSVLVYDASAKKVLYQKNIQKVRPIASLAKLMTAMVAIDNVSDLDREIIIDQKSLNQGYGQVGHLEIGEKISIRNLLYELLMVSSNDAAYLLANAVYQREYRSFTDLMNQKSRSLDLEKTKFTDPSGYTSSTVSTASESIKIFEKALQYPLIKRIVHTQKYSFATFSGHKKHNLYNSNHLFKKIPTMVGGKTGFTDEAGETFVFAFEEPHSQDIIYVSILGAKIGYRFKDALNLYHWLEEKYVW